MSSDRPSSNASEHDRSTDPSTAPLNADLPKPYGGQSLPSSASVSPTHRADAEAPASWTEAEKDALELSDDDLDLVAGGLSTPRLLSSQQAQRLFRSAARPPDEATTSSS